MSRPVEVGSVYVHAPFCARRCGYCDFAVSVRRSADPGPWAAALAGEVRALATEGRVRLADTLDTVYLGGGTPSLLGPDAAASVRAVLGPERFTPATEFTAEANPESFTDEVARAWRGSGVTRLSLGTQSLQDGVLRWMGRLHGAEGSRAAVRVARRAGFDDVGVDLIFGLPDEVERDWKADLDAVLALGAEHLSLYGLTAEAGTPVGRAVAEQRLSMPDDERYRDEFLLAHERLVAEGYEHYEVSNFARPGRRSRHNQVYWTGAPYLGLGNGAHSWLPPERRWNLREWDAYVIGATAGHSTVEGHERVEGASRRLEVVWLALRTASGLDAAGLPADARTRVDGWVREGWAHDDPERVRLTASGWLLLDRLSVELASDLDTPG